MLSFPVNIPHPFLPSTLRVLVNLTERDIETLRRNEFFFCRGDSFYRLGAVEHGAGFRVECLNKYNREEFAKIKSRKPKAAKPFVLPAESISERIAALRNVVAKMKEEEENLPSLNMVSI